VSARRGRRADGERGAVLVEFALVGTLLVTILAGAYDLGQAWRSGLAVIESARAGARVGSSQGVSSNADFSLLSSMKAALSSSGTLDDVTRVVIFKSTTEDGAVPTTCRTATASTSSPCNILTGAQLQALPASVGTALQANGCVINSVARDWCPTTRNDVQASADYLGVWVQIEHDHLFPIFGSSLTIERTAVMRLEP